MVKGAIKRNEQFVTLWLLPVITLKKEISIEANLGLLQPRLFYLPNAVWHNTWISECLNLAQIKPQTDGNY